MRRSVLRHPRLLFVFTLVTLIPAASTVLDGWWDRGHYLTGQAAAEALPPQMPSFFRKAADQLAYLNYEPDRWKDGIERKADTALYGGTSPEHYINFERVPPGLFNLPTRYDFLAAVGRRRQTGTEVGLLPYRILELFQTMRVNFRLWRTAPDAGMRVWIEQRIVDDAGVLGHYVADGANPLHTTVHHNGWVGKNNPNRFTTDDTLHGRFEGKFVDAQFTIADVRRHMKADARILAAPRRDILKFLNESYALVDDVYRLEARERFTEKTDAASHKTFVEQRLAAGATMLRDLWWTAWSTSADTLSSR
jgi:hypothetical protein